MRPVSRLATTTSFSASAVDGFAVGQDVRRQQHASLGPAAAAERVVHALQHLLRSHVGKEAEPATVDAEDRDVGHRGHARRVQHRAVAADCDDQVGVVGQLGLEHGVDAIACQRQRFVRNHAHAVAFGEHVVCERAHSLADARIGRSARDSDTGPAGWACIHGWPAF